MDSKQKQYEEFRLRWMLDHGHTLPELIGELQKLREEGAPELSLQSVFSDWEFRYGFGSEIWPCYEEFLDCEYREMNEHPQKSKTGGTGREARLAGHTENNMQILLSNPSQPDMEGVTLPFPIPNTEYASCIKLLASIGLGAVTERDCQVEAVFQGPPALNCLAGTSANVDELDTLARILRNIKDDGDLEKFEAVAEIRGYTEVKDLINLSLSCQNVGIITDFGKLKEAGNDYSAIHPGPIPHGKAEGRDGEQILLRLIADGKGRVTRYGVVFDDGLEVRQVYRGGNLPTMSDETPLVEAVLTPVVEPQDQEELTLLLPMPEKRLDRMLDRAGIETDDDFNIELAYMELPPGVNRIIEKRPKALIDINRLCQIVQPMSGKQKETLAAAVLLAKPENAAEIRQLAINLEFFDLITDIGSAEEYGQYLIQESGRYTFDENLAPYYNYEKCGREQMESEQGGFNELGYIAYHGELPLLELMMGDPVEEEPKMPPPRPPKRLPHSRSMER